MKILIHACCAPCLTYTYECFKKNDITVYWFNPNIHPYKEYKKRLQSMKIFADLKELKVVYADDHLLHDFLEGAIKADNRCKFCYEWRLGETGLYASENDFDAFTTTLSISPYQDHELLRELGAKMGSKYGLEFVYKDMRNGFRESHELARRYELYLQKYCGCIFSEEERYKS